MWSTHAHTLLQDPSTTAPCVATLLHALYAAFDLTTPQTPWAKPPRERERKGGLDEPKHPKQPEKPYFFPQEKPS